MKFISSKNFIEIIEFFDSNIDLYKNFYGFYTTFDLSILHLWIKIFLPPSDNSLFYHGADCFIRIGCGLLPIIWEGFWPKWAICVSNDIRYYSSYILSKLMASSYVNGKNIFICSIAYFPLCLYPNIKSIQLLIFYEQYADYNCLLILLIK